MSNPTNRDFLNATREQKAVMILDGISRVTYDIGTLATNLKVLNGWIRMLPQLMASNNARLPDPDELERQWAYLAAATDKLTEQFVVNADNVEALKPLYEQLKQNPNV